jgi:hypothetical protein
MQNWLRLLLYAGIFGGVTCGTHGADEKLVQYFGWRAWKEGTTGKT